MRKTYKYLVSIALNGALCLFVAMSANAQHRDGGGSSSGGGGSRSSAPASSGGGSRSVSPPPSSNTYRAPSNNGGSRASYGVANNQGGYRPSINNGARAGYNNNARVAVSNPRFNNLGMRTPSYNVTPGYRTSAAPGAASFGGRTYVNGSRGAVTGTTGYVGAGGRASVGAGGRGYVGSGGRASVGAGGRGYVGTSYWGSRDYYHYNHGYYGTYYAPRLGFSIGFLPYGCYPFYFDDYQYYYSGGLFYQYNNNEYTVVEPPVGAEVTSLPSNAQSIVINGQQYYESNGVYYEAVTKDDGSVSYQVAGKDGELNTTGDNNDVQQAPQVGDLVGQLPPDCRKINLNGEKYYVSPDGYYYQDAKDANNNKAYKIVGTPDEAPSN